MFYDMFNFITVEKNIKCKKNHFHSKLFHTLNSCVERHSMKSNIEKRLYALGASFVLG